MEIVQAKKTYPEWVKRFARKYHSRTLSQYILHGNITDYVPVLEGSKRQYRRLREFLSHDLFGQAEMIVYYDRSSGIRFRDVEMRKDFIRSMEAYDTLHGTNFADAPPKDPVRAFTLLEMHFRKRLMTSPNLSILFLVEYAETLIPMANAAHYNPEDRTVQIFLQRWANEGLFQQHDVNFVLLTENIVNLNQQYIRSPFTYEITIPYPDEMERLDFINHFLDGKTVEGDWPFEMATDVLAKNTAGINLAQLEIILSEVLENKIFFSYEDLNRKKKEVIESEAAGLLEFVKSKYSLSDVAGHEEAKAHLMDVAQALKAGRQDVIPMGYLVAGPVGTGKTFLITCFANDIGVPMVILKNFRSKWQGETEGNLEKVLHLLKAMTPVAVMIDEADAYLGNRNAEGDSGVSSRVFSMLASFMSNTDHRGRIIWFLVTARPDLMPVDFKRQGRAEEHIALFYPQNVAEKRELFAVMLRKTDLGHLKPEDFSDEFFEAMHINSGAEMEAALTRAKFRAASEGADQVAEAHIRAALEDFLPPTYPDQIELMNYAAVLECTSKALLPERYREMSREEVVDRLAILKERVEEQM